MLDTFSFIIFSLEHLLPNDFYLLPLSFMAFGIMMYIIQSLGGKNL